MEKTSYLAVSILALLGIIFGTVWAVNKASSPEEKAADLIVDINHKAGLASEIVTLTNGRSQKAYHVERVVDGDTLTIDVEGSDVTLRLIGVNTPETVDPRKPVECFGKEASAQAVSLLADRNVVLEFDSSQGRWDKYNRLLAYVYREDDGLFVNKYLIENGYGHEYTYRTPYKFQKDFDRAEESARINERGLWAPEACAEFVSSVYEVPKTEPIEVDETKYTCSTNTYNCLDFSSKAQAQEAYLACGGIQNDIHKLDADRDGEACESL